ncbi:MAG: hypothetical protein BZY80_03700 [SAR202 cluster bacterium Io17-Chloro-G2]|nr:MAG: hypothetical protein BZY80_03700 [SAR202 cluster bacterium Io17-Chloro-G2]
MPVYALSLAPSWSMLGRKMSMAGLVEATQTMPAALEAHIALQDWGNAARNANSLSQSCLTTGGLSQCLEYPERSVALPNHWTDALGRITRSC